MRYVVTPATFGKTMRRMLKDHQREAAVAALEAAHYGVARAVEYTEQADKVDLGAYKRGWQVRKHPAGAEIFNDAPYAGVIERGRRPGSAPPLAPILAWVKRKFSVDGLRSMARESVLRRGGTARDVPSLKRPADIEAAQRQIALAVVRKIKERGTKPHFIMRRASRDAFDWYRLRLIKRLTTR